MNSTASKQNGKSREERIAEQVAAIFPPFARHDAALSNTSWGLPLIEPPNWGTDYAPPPSFHVHYEDATTARNDDPEPCYLQRKTGVASSMPPSIIGHLILAGKGVFVGTVEEANSRGTTNYISNIFDDLKEAHQLGFQKLIWYGNSCEEGPQPLYHGFGMWHNLRGPWFEWRPMRQGYPDWRQTYFPLLTEEQTRYWDANNPQVPDCRLMATGNARVNASDPAVTTNPELRLRMQAILHELRRLARGKVHQPITPWCLVTWPDRKIHFEPLRDWLIRKLLKDDEGPLEGKRLEKLRRRAHKMYIERYVLMPLGLMGIPTPDGKRVASGTWHRVSFDDVPSITTLEWWASEPTFETVKRNLGLMTGPKGQTWDLNGIPILVPGSIELAYKMADNLPPYMQLPGSRQELDAWYEERRQKLWDAGEYYKRHPLTGEPVSFGVDFSAYRGQTPVWIRPEGRGNRKDKEAFIDDMPNIEGSSLGLTDTSGGRTSSVRVGDQWVESGAEEEPRDWQGNRRYQLTFADVWVDGWSHPLVYGNKPDEEPIQHKCSQPNGVRKLSAQEEADRFKKSLEETIHSRLIDTLIAIENVPLLEQEAAGTWWQDHKIVAEEAVTCDEGGLSPEAQVQQLLQQAREDVGGYRFLKDSPIHKTLHAIKEAAEAKQQAIEARKDRRTMVSRFSQLTSDSFADWMEGQLAKLLAKALQPIEHLKDEVFALKRYIFNARKVMKKESTKQQREWLKRTEKGDYKELPFFGSRNDKTWWSLQQALKVAANQQDGDDEPTPTLGNVHPKRKPLRKIWQLKQPA